MNLENVLYKTVEKTKLDEVDEQVEIRLHLINNVLVGNLYPQVLLGEITELRKKQRKV